MLNDALRLIRIYHDMNQRELAEKLDISRSHISEIESGKKVPTISLLERYAELFSMPTSSILFFSENLENKSPSEEKVRKFVSSKVIKLLDYIAECSGKDNAL
jgi:transcriptional regulator with XRE-family HTH domain